MKVLERALIIPEIDYKEHLAPLPNPIRPILRNPFLKKKKKRKKRKGRRKKKKRR